jgi:hypothetical protein
MAHTCKPSYSGGRNEEDTVLSQPPANSSWDPISKHTHQKKKEEKKEAGLEAQGTGPEVKPQYHKKINK